MIMARLFRLFFLLLPVGAIVILSGCTGGGNSVYSGYGYPHYGYDTGYHHHYYHDDHYDDRVRRTRPQRVQQRQNRRANMPTRNMGRPRRISRR